MPISTSSFGDKRDDAYTEYQRADLYDQETIEFPGLTPATVEELLKKLGQEGSDRDVSVWVVSREAVR